MSKDFLKIVFTSPGCIEDEAEKLSLLLDSGAADICHLRKPSWSLEDTRYFLKQLSDKNLEMIRLHDHFELAVEFPVFGVQLNRRNPVLPFEDIPFSVSCHSLEEINEIKGADYVTLSPIFNSISKSGYQSKAFERNNFFRILEEKRVMALGGVEPCHFSKLKGMGFSGAAMLGYIWHNPDRKSLNEIVDILKMYKF